MCLCNDIHTLIQLCNYTCELECSSSLLLTTKVWQVCCASGWVLNLISDHGHIFFYRSKRSTMGIYLNQIKRKEKFIFVEGASYFSEHCSNVPRKTMRVNLHNQDLQVMAWMRTVDLWRRGTWKMLNRCLQGTDKPLLMNTSYQWPGKPSLCPP